MKFPFRSTCSSFSFFRKYVVTTQCRRLHLCNTSSTSKSSTYRSLRWLNVGGTLLIGSVLFHPEPLFNEHSMKPSILMSDQLEMVMDPSTKLEVPRYLNLHGQGYQLVGVGARQVTFLKINVYSVGFYTKDSTPPPSFHTLLNSDSVLYITPTRPAELSHLRDGLLKHIKKNKQIEAHWIQAFSNLFPKNRIMRGESLVIEKHALGLTLYLDGRKLGDIHSLPLAHALFHAYLTDPPVSPKLLNSIKESSTSL
ncbi:hypothetical protein HMI54_012082 [Coelomomyces lativittatus]|nr:hypothetical protein HMI55_004927 [Coelomomyces lativittatus]KAJ1515570.1 hypothetical protein HMI54_012082 [Coelomomyces lativittatus]KAJ1515832.1 hypothetical protein HMI56_000306 [Coelomomyces lativittatus]KAJ1515834.1 hypothetical protein HMI56_000308 [Coelomomyces lativittatus]